jgi:hypothetical protein
LQIQFIIKKSFALIKFGLLLIFFQFLKIQNGRKIQYFRFFAKKNTIFDSKTSNVLIFGYVMLLMKKKNVASGRNKREINRNMKDDNR